MRICGVTDLFRIYSTYCNFLSLILPYLLHYNLNSDIIAITSIYTKSVSIGQHAPMNMSSVCS